MNTVYINGKQVGQCTYAQIRPTVGSKSIPENYDIKLSEFVSVQQQPQLNENQQIVLDYLKRKFNEEPDISKKSIFKAIDHLLYNFWDDNLNDAFYALDLKQESQALQEFIQWALEQEEE